MSDISAAISIDAGDLARLRELPGQIRAAAETAQAALDAIRGGDGANALGALIGGLDQVPGLGTLPDFAPVLAPLDDLLARLPAGALADIATAGEAITGFLDLFGPLKEVLLSGELTGGLDDAIGRSLEAVQRLARPTPEITEVHREFEEFQRLFRFMLGWSASPPTPAEVTDLLSRALIGIAPDALAAPMAALEAALAPLDDLLPEGPRLAQWRAAPAERLGFWTELAAGLSGGIDWLMIEARLDIEARALLDLSGLRDRLRADLLGALDGFALPALPEVAGAIAALPPLEPAQLTPILDGIRRQIQGAAEDLEAWAPTPEQAEALAQGLATLILDYIEDSPLGQIRRFLIDLQQRLLLAIENLPFDALAREAEAALRDLAEAIAVFDPESLRAPVRDLFAEMEGALGAIDPAEVQTAIQEVWDMVADALATVADGVRELRGLIEGLVGDLQGYVDQTASALATITEAAETISTTLAAFDLREPADQVIAALRDLEQTVRGLDLSSLPGPAVEALHQGAQLLRGIDVTAAITPGISEVLDEIDPTPLLEGAVGKLDDLLGTLRPLDPASLARELDGPIDALLASLSQFGPERLQALLQAALDPIEAELNRLDFAAILAPLTGLSAQLQARIDSFLDPALIFGPLEEAFQPVLDVVDRLEPSRLIGALSTQDADLGRTVAGLAAPPAAVTGGGGLLREAIPDDPATEDPMFGFRPGDLLLPLIDLHRRMAAAFDGLSDGVLDAAHAELRAALPGRLTALMPGSVSARVEDHFVLLRTEFDPPALSVRFHDAALAFHDAVAALARAEAEGLAPEQAAARGRVLARLPTLDPLALLPTSAEAEAVFTATLAAEGAIDLSALRRSLAPLDRLATLLPDFLGQAETGANILRQALRDLDPGPIRDEVNAAFDRLGQRLVALQEPLLAALSELFETMEAFLMPLTPGALVQLADRLHRGLRAQVAAFSPARFRDEMTALFDAAKAQLAILDPAFLAEELNGLRDALIARLRALVAAALPDGAPFAALMTELAGLKPSALLQPLAEALAPVSELIASLDPRALIAPLIEAIARIKAQIPEIIADIEAALDAVLDAFPQGGPANGSASVGVSVNV